jgi:hypothetical protein
MMQNFIQFKFFLKYGTVSGTQIEENPLRFTIGLKKALLHLIPSKPDPVGPVY